MPVIEMKVPVISESINEVTLSWLKPDGSFVKLDEPICEIESDKSTLEFSAEAEGKLIHVAKEGDDLKIGALMAKIDTSVKASIDKTESAPPSKEKMESTPETKEATKDNPKEKTSYMTQGKIASSSTSKILHEAYLQSADMANPWRIKATKFLLIILSGLIFFNIAFVSSKTYSSKGNSQNINIGKVSEDQYYSYLYSINNDIYLDEPASITRSFITNTKIQYLFGLPGSLLIFIYFSYFLIIMGLIILAKFRIYGNK